jgi:hypothetical protein
LERIETPVAVAAAIWLLVPVLLYLPMPVICWYVLSRVRTTRIVIGVILVTFGVVTMLLAAGVLPTRVRWELVLAYAPVASTLVWLGVSLENRRLTAPTPIGQQRTRLLAQTMLVGYAGASLLCCTPAASVVIGSDAFLPSNSELLPLPTPLIVVSNSVGCGSESCSRDITVGSSTGLPADQILQRLRAHLTQAHAWQLSPSDSACRPNGWLIDRRSLCIQISATAPQEVLVQLDSGANPPT